MAKRDNEVQVWVPVRVLEEIDRVSGAEKAAGRKEPSRGAVIEKAWTAYRAMTNPPEPDSDTVTKLKELEKESPELADTARRVIDQAYEYLKINRMRIPKQ